MGEPQQRGGGVAGDSGEADASLADYYEALTHAAVNHPAGLLAIHYGLWGPETQTDRDSLLRANRTLIEGCELKPGQTVLDAGCGVGGMAIWLAQEYGVRAVGLTNCEPHVQLAEEQAQQRGVADLVEFRYGDFMQMPFAAASFDAVLNHETYCYAPDKLAFLRGVHRILKPGGRWQAVDGFLSGKRLSETDESIHKDMQKGWRTEPLQPWREVMATLDEAGFGDIGNRDLESEVATATARLRKLWELFGHMFTPAGEAWAYNEFKQGVISFDEGLNKGVFAYHLIFGVKPG